MSTTAVTLTFTPMQLAEALCRTAFYANWQERADEIIGMLGADSIERCDNCRAPVRIMDGLNSGGYAHVDDLVDATAQFCETETGFVRVTVNGEKHSPTSIGRI